MGFVLMKQELKHVLNCSIQDVTSRFAGIELTEGDAALSDDICTVHTILEGNCRGALLLCADTALLTRVAQKIMGSENVTLRDIEDVATEYFNVICGGGGYLSDHPRLLPLPDPPFPDRALSSRGARLLPVRVEL